MLQLNIPPSLIKLLRISLTDLGAQNFFGQIVYKTIDYRVKNKVVRNDLLDLLIALKTDQSSGISNDSKDQEDLRKFIDEVGDSKESSNDLSK